MSTAEFAEKFGAPYTTVMTWLKRGLIPGATLKDYPRGQVWEIPRAALKTFRRPKRGRRPKKDGG